MERRSLRIGAIMAALALAITAAAYIRIKNSPDVKYVPTPPNVVAEMLKLAEVDADDVVYDLGSGDGRIPIAAVRDFSARRGVGIDIDAALVGEANQNARKAGVAEKTQFIRGDLFQHDFSEATVLTMYLLPEIAAAPENFADETGNARRLAQFHDGRLAARSDARRESGGRKNAPHLSVARAG